VQIYGRKFEGSGGGAYQHAAGRSVPLLMSLKRKVTTLAVVTIPTTATGAVEEAVEVAEVVDHGQAPFFLFSALAKLLRGAEEEAPMEVILAHHTWVIKPLFQPSKFNGPNSSTSCWLLSLSSQK